MFCPKCATQNIEGAHFCRVCGANISLVPQAMTGQLPQVVPEDDIVIGRRGRRRNRELSLDHSFKNIFMGIAFLLVAIALSRSIGGGWWFWMLLPAFSMMGTGIAQYIRLKEREKQSFVQPGPVGRQIPSRPVVAARDFPRPDTGELLAPPGSVTEGTTRHLGVEAQTRHLDGKEPL